MPPASSSLARSSLVPPPHSLSLSLSLSLLAASRRICVTYPDGVAEINNLTGAYPIYRCSAIDKSVHVILPSRGRLPRAIAQLSMYQRKREEKRERERERERERGGEGEGVSQCQMSPVRVFRGT